MKRWRQILEQHHNVEILSDTQVKVVGVICDTVNKTVSDDIITRNARGYTDSQGYNYSSIYEYLGY